MGNYRLLAPWLPLGLIACLPSAAQTWDQLAPTGTPPSAREHASAVLDPSANQVIVYGGELASTPLTDTWRLTLGANPAWTQIAGIGNAPAYGNGSAVYDAANSRLIVFGGYGQSVYSDQVLVLTNANGQNGAPTWITLDPTGIAPLGRAGHAALYDSANNRMIVFGGYTGNTYLGDVWVLTNANGLSGTPAWIQLAPAGGGPGPRSLDTALYDTANNRMIVFGGYTGSFYNDAWVLANANGLGGTPTWMQLDPTGTAPAPRAVANGFFDPSTGQVVVFGGEDDTAVFSDVWTLAGANGLGGTPAWTDRLPAGSPGARGGAAAAYNPGNDELILVGGYNGAVDVNDTWALDDANWAPAPDLVLTALSGPAFVSGAQVTGSVTLANEGTAASAPFTLEYYWSKSPIITTAAMDSGWGCFNVTVPAGSNFTCNGSIGVPATLGSGTWYLGAIADPSMSIPELNKTNNARAADTGATQIPSSTVACTASSMNFSYMPGGLPPPSQSCTVTTVPPGFGIVATVTTGNWLSAVLSPAGSPASSPATLTVSVTGSGFAPGSYTGTVSLQATGGGTFTIASTLTVIQPSLTISKAHTGNFNLGQQGAYTVTVSNTAGAGSASGTVTVTENVPTGMTLVSMAGSGWNCPGGNTCTRVDGLNGGASYPPIAVTVNVAANAISPQVNSVSVSGGGSAGAAAADSTIINGGATASAYLIGTVAGGGLPATPAPATGVALASPVSVTVDANGNLYLSADNCVYKADTSGTLTRVAGSSTVPDFSGDGGPAASARLSYPERIAVDSVGNIYFADESNNRIRKVAAGIGTIGTFAGNGSYGSTGDGGPAISAGLSLPVGVALDGNGNLFIADYGGNRIRKVVIATGIITTVAGTGLLGYSGDGGLAVSAQLGGPLDVAVDGFGNLYIADTFNNRVRKVAAATGIITTAAGNGTAGYSGDGGLAISAEVNDPYGVAVDGNGNVYIADTFNSRIRKVAAGTGVITTVAGNGTLGYSGDSGPATSAELGFPQDLAVDTHGNMYIADSGNNRIRMVSAGSGIIITVAGAGSSYSGDGQPATSAQISSDSFGVAVDRLGNLYIADTGNSRVRKVAAATGIITTYAGTGVAGYSGDNIPAASAEINQPWGLAVDTSGNLYIADSGNNRIRVVSAVTGMITTVAGNGSLGFTGDGGPATSAEIALPFGIAVDGSGNIFIGDFSARVRKVIAATGNISTVAGNGTAGYTGDNGPATAAELGSPLGVALDGSGNLYIADSVNYVIRKVATGTGIITTFAGNGTAGNSGDGGLATAAEITLPRDVKVGNGKLYIAGLVDQYIRTVELNTGVITTLAGDGTNVFDNPLALALGANGQVYIADNTNSGGIVDLVNDSGAPASQITAGNAASSDHLTFNLLIRASGVQPAGAADTSVAAKARARVEAAPLTSSGSGGSVTVGGTVQYTQTLVRDASSPAATNVVVGNTLPPSWTITGCTSDSGGTCTQTGGNQISISYPSVSTGQSPSITVTADETGSQTSLEVDSSASSTSANLATSSTLQFLLASPGTSIALSFQGPSSTAPEQSITYSVALNNTGAAKLAGDPLTVTLAVDPNLTAVFPSADPSWTCTQTGATLVCVNSSAVAASGQIAFSVTGTVPAGAAANTILTTSATLAFGGQLSAPQPVNTTVGESLPSAPTLLSPANALSGVSTTVDLAWAAAAGANSYAVYFGTSNPPPLLVQSTALLTYSPGTLTTGSTYYWKIAAVNSFGSTSSPLWAFTTGPNTGGCQFTLNGGNTASLTSAGTATISAAYPGGVAPEIPVTVTIAPGSGCSSSYTAVSSATWLTATVNGSNFTYTALSNTHPSPRSATLTIANSSGGLQTFTVTEAGDSETLQNRQVRALYQSMLGRDPDPSGFAFWTGSGAAGLGQMADDFLTSPEAFNSDFAVMATYQATTGAVPGYAAFTTAVGAIRANTGTIAQLFASLIAGNPGYSATTLYQNLLNRVPTASEIASAGTTPAALAAWFEALIGYPSSITPVGAPNNEFQSTGTFHTLLAGCPTCGVDHTNGMYIAMLYYTILGRDLDVSGYDFWLGVANSGGPGIAFQGAAAYSTRIQILGPGTPTQGFIGSPEFQGLYQ